jgi:hypothetical protein
MRPCPRAAIDETLDGSAVITYLELSTPPRAPS